MHQSPSRTKGTNRLFLNAIGARGIQTAIGRNTLRRLKIAIDSVCSYRENTLFSPSEKLILQPKRPGDSYSSDVIPSLIAYLVNSAIPFRPSFYMRFWRWLPTVLSVTFS